MDDESREILAEVLMHLDGAATLLGKFAHRIYEDGCVPQEVCDSHATRVAEALLSITGGMTTVGKILLVDAGAKMVSNEVDALLAMKRPAIGRRPACEPQTGGTQ